MAITVSCVCSKQLRLKDAFAGKRVKCPACGKSMQVPGASNGSASNGHPAPPAADAPFDFSAPAAPPAPALSAEVKPPAPAPAEKPPTPAAVQTAPPAPPAPVGEAGLPGPAEETPPASGKRTAALVAVLAAFCLLVAGLVIVVMFLLKQSGDDAKGPGDGSDMTEGNKDSKLTREELEQKAIQASKVKQADEAKAAVLKKAQDDLNSKQAAAEAQRKKEAEDKLRREREADAALRKVELEAKLKIEAEKRAADLAKQRAERAQKLVVEGQAALARKEVDKAAKLFLEANQLAPTNPDAKAGLDKANQELRLVQAAKLSQEGRNNLAAKKYALALSQLEEATRLDPNDDAAAAALKKARAEQLKIDKEVERLLARGRKALKLHNFKAAAKAIDTADKFAPNHPAVAVARRELDAEQARVLAEAGAKKQNRALADAAIKKARAALKKDEYAEAEQQALLATKLFPDDVIAKSLLRRARAGLARLGVAAKHKKLAEEKLQREKNRKEAAALVKKGRNELEEKLYQEAFTDLSRADALVPGDRITKALLKKAQKGLDGIRLAEAKKRKKSEEERKRVEDAERAKQIRLLLDRARKALDDKKLDEAEKLLADLRKLSPDDPDVTSLLRDLAQARKAEAATRKELEAKLAAEQAEAAHKKMLADFDALMKAGEKALKDKKFDGAIKQFSAALQLVEKDKDSADLAKKAKQAIADAKKARDLDAKLKLKIDE